MGELKRNRRPSMPGDNLKGLFLEPRGVTVKELAETIGVSTKHVSQLVNGHVRISPQMAAKLGKVFGNGARVWLDLQAAVDAWDAEREAADWTPPRTFDDAA